MAIPSKSWINSPNDVRYADMDDIPTQLPNPKALTFTGAVSASYNGSSAVSVNIPAAKPVIYQVTVPTSGWSNNNGLYSRSITVSGITASDYPDVDLREPADSYSTVAQIKQVEAWWSNVCQVDTYSNGITIYAFAAPTLTVYIQLKVVR